MRTFQVSDELYEQLKSFVVDPFDDSPEAVIGRLIEIVNKAKNRWSPFDEEAKPSGTCENLPPASEQQTQKRTQEQERDIDEVVLL
jgi:hypothetical protein